MLKKTLLMISLSSSLAFASASYADDSSYNESTSQNMNVTLTVLKACSLTTNPLDFGKQYSNAGDVSVQTAVSVVCTKNTPYKISSDNSHDYEMSDGHGNKVAYTLYSDSAESAPFTTATPGTGTGVTQSISIYGKVSAAALQAAPAGSYTDTVALTVNY